MTDLHLDFEGKSRIELFDRGLDVYAKDASTEILMAGFALDDGPVEVWDKDAGHRMPGDLKEALRDPDVTIWAFNAQFERWLLNEKLVKEYDWDPLPVERFKCSMVLSYMFSFTGGLDAVTTQMAAKGKEQMDPEGKRLINVFCKPNKPTKNQPFVWRDRHSDPEDWDKFLAYCGQDVTAERDGIKSKLLRYTTSPEEWDAYHLDQIINDRGLPMNRTFIISALAMADRRKAELISEMKPLTGVDNPNSRDQLLPWLKERGYPFDDLQKDSVTKVLKAEAEDVKGGNLRPPWLLHVLPSAETGATLDAVGRVVGDHLVTQECRDVMVLRQSASKTSTTKYQAALDGMLDDDDRLRHCFQFAGASRTNRWAGRKIQPQNLPRTPKYLEPEKHINFDRLQYTTDLIETGNYGLLTLFTGEPMDSIAGCVRSSITATDGKVLQVCDLSSIETVVIFWLTGCTRGLEVIRSGLDPYKDFATELFGVAYDDVTKKMRTDSKPPVLGAGYRLSGGELKEGKRTGLWGYAENMGIDLTYEQSHKAVDLYRATYPEVPKGWYGIEDAIVKCLRFGRKTTWGPKGFELEFEVKKPFLRVRLPSGRYMWYYKAKVDSYEMEGRYGPYQKWAISYMGIDQVTKQWKRIESHGGKFIENFVQAIARDILMYGMKAAHADGFYLVGHVHDELISEEDEDDDYHTWERLRYLMSDYLIEKYDWLRDVPLGAAGYAARVYRKD